MTEKPKRPPGRPKVYAEGRDGAPFLGLRLDPPIYQHIKARPEGPRAYVQRLVTEDIERTSQGANEPALDDVPGQLLLNGASGPASAPPLNPTAAAAGVREVTHE